MDKHNFTFIKTSKKYIKLYFEEIAFIKGLGNYVEIVLVTNTRYIYYKSLKNLLDSLPDYFMRIHNSYIVNLITIDAFEDNHIIVKGHNISVGKSFRECLRNTLEKRLL